MHEKPLPIFLTNKKHSAICFTFFEKTSQKKCNSQKIFNGSYFLLDCCRNMNFGLFWAVKLQFLKNVVGLVFSKQSESYNNLNVKSRLKFNTP